MKKVGDECKESGWWEGILFWPTYYSLITDSSAIRKIKKNPGITATKCVLIKLKLISWICVFLYINIKYIPAVPRKAFSSADSDTIYIIYLFLCTQSADANAFREKNSILDILEAINGLLSGYFYTLLEYVLYITAHGY